MPGPRRREDPRQAGLSRLLKTLRSIDVEALGRRDADRSRSSTTQRAERRSMGDRDRLELMQRYAAERDKKKKKGNPHNGSEDY